MTAPRTSRLRRRRLTALVAVVLLAAMAAGCASNGSASTGTDPNRVPVAREITVAAASDLRPAFEELGADFSRHTGTKVTFSFGSSGQLSEQIVNGAPFDLFASASVDYVDKVIAGGRGRPDTKADYAYGRIVLWVPAGARPPETVADLADPAYRTIAIANPAHAPYGLAAQQALETAGVHTQVKERLVYGQNIADTLRIVQSRNADVGIVALSLALDQGGAYTLIPEAMHEPLRQALVVTATGARGDAATAFAEWISSPVGRDTMNRYGFVLPGDRPLGER